jgi:hypothetical protein
MALILFAYRFSMDLIVFRQNHRGNMRYRKFFLATKIHGAFGK